MKPNILKLDFTASYQGEMKRFVKFDSKYSYNVDLVKAIWFVYLYNSGAFLSKTMRSTLNYVPNASER